MPIPSPPVLVFTIQSVLALTVWLVPHASLLLRKTKSFQIIRSFMAPLRRDVHGVEEEKFKRPICAGNTPIIWKRPCQNSIVSGVGTERRQLSECIRLRVTFQFDDRLVQTIGIQRDSSLDDAYIHFNCAFLSKMMYLTFAPSQSQTGLDTSTGPTTCGKIVEKSWSAREHAGVLSRTELVSWQRRLSMNHWWFPLSYFWWYRRSEARLFRPVKNRFSSLGCPKKIQPCIDRLFKLAKKVLQRQFRSCQCYARSLFL